MDDIKVPISEDVQTFRPKKLGVRHFQIFLMFVTLLIFYGHRIILSVGIIAMTAETPPDPSIPTYPNWTNTDTILSSFFWGYIVPQVGAGQLGEHFGPKWFLFGTMIIGCIFNILVPTMAASLGPTGVIICRVIQGLTQGFLFPSVHTLLSKWTPLYERSTMSSVVYAGATLGIVVSMIATGAICGSSLGWPSAFYIYGGCGIVWAVVFVIFAENSPSDHKKISAEEKRYIESSNSISHERKKVPTPWRAIATSLPVWTVVITTCGQAWGSFTLLTEIPSYMSNLMNFDISSNSQLSALPYCVLLVITIASAPVADRLISNKTLTIGATRKVFNLIGTLIPAATLFALGFADGSQKDLTLALLVLAVASTGLIYSGSQVNLIDLAPNHAGTLLGIANGSSTVCSILGPLSVQFFGSDKTDPILWRKVFWLAAGLYVCGGLFFGIFSSGEVQWWNDPEEIDTQNEEKKKENC
ncbi:putative inorganic phosphate cotransporter [Tenebrio molitor]|uniref:putative inorganic phosphate cotransporter n=1 Tax=Tenebrio molitor TaxID=7067 RepID=UPI0036247F28